MPYSITQLRDLLQISQSDLAYLVGRSKALICHFERGRVMEAGKPREQLFELHRLMNLVKKGTNANPWLDHGEMQKEATRWERTERQKAAAMADATEFKLKTMEQDYEKSMGALGILDRLQSHRECPDELRKWIQVIVHQIAAKAKRNSPMQQARLRILRDQWLGRIK